jgi:hypothetical protein
VCGNSHENCEALSFTNFLVNTLNKLITHYRWPTALLFIVNICWPIFEQVKYLSVLRQVHSVFQTEISKDAMRCAIFSLSPDEASRILNILHLFSYSTFTHYILVINRSRQDFNHRTHQKITQ